MLMYTRYYAQKDHQCGINGREYKKMHEFRIYNRRFVFN